MSGGKLTSVQALRGVAVLLVVWAHIEHTATASRRATSTGTASPPGCSYPTIAGVDLFFVISGVIITITTWRSFDAPGVRSSASPTAGVTRIYPLYWIVTTVGAGRLPTGPDLVNSHSPHSAGGRCRRS